MRIELLKSQVVPFSDETAPAGIAYDVVAESRSSPTGVWIKHGGHPLFVVAEDYRILDEQERSAAFVRNRAVLFNPRHALPCGCAQIGVLQECPLHDRSPSPFNVHPNGRPL
jgi:hypothetical protein